MTQLPCPQWDNPEPSSNLDSIATAAVAIYEFIKRQNPKKYILGHGDLKTWHGKLFRDVVPVPYYAGNYRSPDRRFPCLMTDVQVPSGAIGTPFQDVPASMENFSRKLAILTTDVDRFVGNQKADVLRLKAATQIASFAAGSIMQIHPFLNGNGRTARLTVNFFLNRYGFRMPFFINRPLDGVDYIAASDAAMHGDFNPLANYLVALLAA